MAASVERLDEKIHGAKVQLLRAQVADGLGGAQGYYKQYAQAVAKAQSQWRLYRRLPTAAELDQEIDRRHSEAWGQYVADLRRRGWTPQSVPWPARGRVAQTVRKRVPVPAGWQPDDEAGFRKAVASRMRSAAGGGQRELVVRGRAVPPGLSWTEFFAHRGVQEEIKTALGLPHKVALLPEYRTPAAFSAEVFQPLVRHVVARQLELYETPAASFATGAAREQVGLDAARAAIVPPVALFFSLMGAIGHSAKLAYLIARILLPRARRLWLLPVGLLLGLWLALSSLDNAVTRSRLYGYVRGQVLQDSATGPVGARALANALHVVSVGQGYGYPFNEFVRTSWLRGINYGYRGR